MRLTTVLYLIASIALATPASAQAPPGKPIPDVVVIGKRDHQDAAHRFVNEVTVEREGQVAQFGEPICPLVLGLPSTYDAIVRNRVLKDAEAAKVRTAGARCDPNVIVMITDDGHRLLDRLHATRREVFEGMDLHTLQALLSEPGPVHAWQGVELLSQDGTPLGLGDPNSVGFVTAKNYDPSRITEPFRWRIDTAFLVIDVKAIDGLTLTQVADYAAMRTLAITRDPKASSLGEDSILTLFDDASGASKPASLSNGDAAYLHALYATSNGVSGSAQRSNMALSISRTLSAPAPQSR
jgi:hypothetical protein